jgi:DNA (cytosine-5)-methyltransferase 1
MIGIDLFSGAGGMSVGAKQAGLPIKMAVEFDRYAAQTYRANHPDTSLIIDDIRNIDFRNLVPSGDNVILFGGPPCQGFSTSNQRNRSIDNPNNWLFQEFLRAVKETHPAWVIFENVRGILETENAVLLNLVKSGLTKLGYHFETEVLDAAKFGVPQKRSRFFLIGSRQNYDISFPKPSDHPPPTVRDAIYDLPDLENGSNIASSGYRNSFCSSYARPLRGTLAKTFNHLVTRNGAHILDGAGCLRGCN